MDLSIWIEKLADAGLAGNPDIYGLAEYDPDRMDLERLPAIWVLPESESASTDGMVATVTEMITLVFAVRNASDRHGRSSVNDLLPLREEVKRVLQGRPFTGECNGTVTFVSGAPQGFDDDHVFWWFDSYEMAHVERT